MSFQNYFNNNNYKYKFLSSHSFLHYIACYILHSIIRNTSWKSFISAHKVLTHVFNSCTVLIKIYYYFLIYVYNLFNQSFIDDFWGVSNLQLLNSFVDMATVQVYLQFLKLLQIALNGNYMKMPSNGYILLQQ